MPSSNGCAAAAWGSIQRRPCAARSSRRKKGEAAASGWIAEQRSWRKPGSVSGSVVSPPPISAARSRTSTRTPASARLSAAASPFGPEPTTTASGARTGRV